MWNSMFLVLVLLFFNVASSQTIIETLPGYPGKLPFKMETGYVGVGEMDDVQLFYYFFESERDPVYDPVMLWLTGGPGCSGFSAIAFETGPLAIAYDTYTGGLPSLKYNPFTWTKIASIIYIDQPVGAGFSYATTTDAANSSDILAPVQAYNFLRKWLVNHPKYLGNQIYIGGDSYSGLIVPQLVQHVLEGIESGLKPHIDLQGYVLGNPVTDYEVDQNSRIPFVHRTSLISDEYYKAAKLYCDDEYVTVEANNTKCVIALQNIMLSLLQIKLTYILEPQCAFTSKKTSELEWDIASRERHIVNLLQDGKLPELRCREFGYALSYKYMNNDTVQTALGVRNGTVENWSRCLKTFSTYTEVVESIVYIHKNLSKTGLRALIYNGDHDISVPYIGTLEWIKSLEIPVFDEWRPWYVDGQVAGYQTKFMNSQFRLTYATVKGGGHTAPEYKPQECQALVDRFFARYPI